jgi:hypothetical protein
MNITTKNLHEFTEQEIFDYVVDKLFAQGECSMDNLGTCMYRGPNNTKCAAGHLIADEDYDSSFEGETWGHLVWAKYFTSDHETLIEEMQSMHDRTALKTLENFNEVLDRYADRCASLLRLKYTRKFPVDSSTK